MSSTTAKQYLRSPTWQSTPENVLLPSRLLCQTCWLCQTWTG